MNAFFSSAGKASSAISKGNHSYGKVIQPGSYGATENTASNVACAVDLTEVNFAVQDKIPNVESNDDQGYDDFSTTLDVFVFPTPVWCSGAEDDQSCDLAIMGVGMTHQDEDNGEYWDLCYKGAAHVSGWYKGYHTTITIPSSGPMDEHVKHGLVAPYERGGRVFKTIFGNCNPDSRPVHVSGKINFQCGRDPLERPSSIGTGEYVPIPYPVVSVLVFVICALCAFRIQLRGNESDNEYDETMQSE